MSDEHEEKQRKTVKSNKSYSTLDPRGTENCPPGVHGVNFSKVKCGTYEFHQLPLDFTQK